MRDYVMHVQQLFSMGRRTLVSLAYVVAAAGIGVVGCGGGGGDDGEVVRLAVGTRVVDGDSPARAVILRSAGNGWEPVGQNVEDLQVISTVVFASPDIAWAYGGGLIRSTDAGETWVDVTDKLPAEVRDGPYVLRSLTFSDATRGYLGTFRVDRFGFPLDGPFVWVTRDGAESWSVVADVPAVPQEVGFDVGVRDGVAEILRHPASAALGAIVAPIDGGGFAPQTVATSAATFRRGFSTVGARGWIAFSVGVGDDLVQSHPAILTSVRPGAPWIQQAVPDISAHEFGSIDMCNGRVGLAGGATVTPQIAPVVLWTEDGGDAWQSAVVADGEGLVVSDVVCVREREMWAALYSPTTHEGALVVSTNGGRDFDRLTYPMSDLSQIYGLASNRLH